MSGATVVGNGPRTEVSSEIQPPSPEQRNLTARQTLLRIHDARGSQPFDLSGAQATVGRAKDGQVFLNVSEEGQSTTVTIKPNGELYASSVTDEVEPVINPQSGVASYHSKPHKFMPVPEELARSYVERAGKATLQNK